MSDRNDAIIKKIRGLLALSNNQKDDEESQTAFIMAQKLMMKYDISMSQIESSANDQKAVKQGQVTVHKKLYWWERELAQIIADNFRVKFFYNCKKFRKQKQAKQSIVFLGYESDVALAKEMYILAYDVLTFYTKRFIDEYYQATNHLRTHQETINLKNSYQSGFLEGLSNKFEQQVEEMKQEYGLMVLTPKEVQDQYNEMFEGTKGATFKMPKIEEIAAYTRGYNEGNSVDYTKSTIDDEILN